MNKHLWALTAAGLLLAGGPVASAHAQSQGYSQQGIVVDVNPIRNGARQVCEPAYGQSNTYDRYDRQDSGYDPGYDRYPRQNGQVGGAVAGALIGGVLGNQIGDGSGRTAATIGGALLGGLAGREIGGNAIPRDNGRYASDYNRYPDRSYDYNQGQRCWTEYGRGGRVTAYEVRYRADGRIYTTQLPYAPSIGSRIRINQPSW